MQGGTGPSGGGFGSGPQPTPANQARRGSSGIPAEVASRMVRRIAISAGIPTVLGMGAFVVSYLLVARGLRCPPSRRCW